MYSRLDHQKSRYGPFLFIRDENGLHNCFFKGCGQSYRHNFSRHIAYHEKRGDEIDWDFVEKQKQKYKDHPQSTNSAWKTRLEKRQKDPMYQCKELVEKMRRLRSAAPFLNASDTENKEVEEYYKRIKDPIDLITISKKLDKGEYNDLESFARDVRLITNNARLNN
jgi:hypothetical protein